MIPHPQRLLHDTLLAASGPACGLSPVDYRGKVAVIAEGEPHSYGELLDAALRLAGALSARGLRRGDRVAIYMDNTWPCVVSIYATLIGGGAFITVNPQTKSDKLEF